MEPKLLPCPFCGGDAKLAPDSLYLTQEDKHQYWAYAYCTYCNAEIESATESFDTAQEAIDAVVEKWNKRC